MRESKSRALPLGYTPMRWDRKAKDRSGRSGPSALRSYGVGDGTRTHDTRNHNPMLYQLNYTHHIKDRVKRLRKWFNDTEPLPPLLDRMARQKGLEPPAHCLEGSCSIQLSYWRVWSG